MDYIYVIDLLQKIFSIIGSLSLGVALITYFYKKKQDETLATIDQISFFREKIILEWDIVSRFIKTKNPKYWFSRIKLHKYNIEDMRVEFSRNFKDQLSIFYDTSNDDPMMWSIDNSILDKQILLLNMLEEFSLKVNHFNTQEHPALDSIHATFIEVIEKNAVALVFMRDIITNNPIYSAILSLYNSWENKVEKSNYFNNLEKHGFLTKEVKEEIFRKQRKMANK